MRLSDAVRGTVCHISQFQFSPSDNTRNKYCILLENYYPSASSLVAIFTTSNFKYEYLSWTIRANIPGILGDTLIDLKNYHFVDISIISSRNTRNLGIVPLNILHEIDNGLCQITDISPADFIHMLP